MSCFINLKTKSHIYYTILIPKPTAIHDQEGLYSSCFLSFMAMIKRKKHEDHFQ